jgi:hypothetical protein
MYSWLLIIYVLSAKDPEPILQKRYYDAETCEMLADGIEQNTPDKGAVCVPQYRTDGGSWESVDEVHDRT